MLTLLILHVVSASRSSSQIRPIPSRPLEHLKERTRLRSNSLAPLRGIEESTAQPSRRIEPMSPMSPDVPRAPWSAPAERSGSSHRSVISNRMDNVGRSQSESQSGRALVDGFCLKDSYALLDLPMLVVKERDELKSIFDSLAMLGLVHSSHQIKAANLLVPAAIALWNKISASATAVRHDVLLTHCLSPAGEADECIQGIDAVFGIENARAESGLAQIDHRDRLTAHTVIRGHAREATSELVGAFRALAIKLDQANQVIVPLTRYAITAAAAAGKSPKTLDRFSSPSSSRSSDMIARAEELFSLAEAMFLERESSIGSHCLKDLLKSSASALLQVLKVRDAYVAINALVEMRSVIPSGESKFSSAPKLARSQALLDKTRYLFNLVSGIAAGESIEPVVSQIKFALPDARGETLKRWSNAAMIWSSEGVSVPQVNKARFEAAELDASSAREHFQLSFNSIIPELQRDLVWQDPLQDPEVRKEFETVIIPHQGLSLDESTVDFLHDENADPNERNQLFSVGLKETEFDPVNYRHMHEAKVTREYLGLIDPVTEMIARSRDAHKALEDYIRSVY